jgi:hypothetical protein
VAVLRSGLVIAASLCAIGAIGPGCGSSADSPASARPTAVDRFDSQRALALVRRQVAVGQRPAGSPQLRRLARALRPLLPNGHFEPLPGEPGLRNVVGTVPGRLPGIVIGAHYDTLVKPKGFVGANNGAAGTAIVIQAARALEHLQRPASAPAIRFVLFDGEEPAQGLPEEQTDFYSSGLRGSRAYAAAHARQTRSMLLLDYVANRGLRLPHEPSSDAALWKRVRAAAGRVGAAAVFPDADGPEIVDDHTPFLHAGVPAVDFIDWSYDGHSLSDGLDKLSAKAADAVGETVVELLRR